MNLFFRLFDFGIPVHVIITDVALAFVASLFGFYVCKGKRFSHVVQIWIIAYLFLMLYSTVIGRTPQLEVSIHLIPFWSIGAIQSGLIETIYEKLNNVIFFIPYGLLLALYFNTKPVWNSVKIGILTSIVIELLQLVTKTGMCETDDVICNTLGCFIGAILVYGVNKAVRLLRKG